MKHILVTLNANEAHKQKLTDACRSAMFMFITDPEESDISWADVIIGDVKADLLQSATRLEWLQLPSAGADRYTKENVLPKGVTLTNATGAYGVPVSEHAAAAMLTLAKKLHLYRDNQILCEWKRRGDVVKIAGSTALILGLGDIGTEFARRAKGLSMYVIGVKRTVSEKPDFVDELYTVDYLDDILPAADVVMMALPATKETRGIMSRERLALLKPSAMLINVGRGNAVDTEALADALEKGTLYAASLDVTDPEPLPAEHRLWRMENALITPHVSGTDTIPATFDAVVELIAANVARYEKGEPLQNVVSLETGYMIRPAEAPKTVEMPQQSKAEAVETRDTEFEKLKLLGAVCPACGCGEVIQGSLNGAVFVPRDGDATTRHGLYITAQACKNCGEVFGLKLTDRPGTSVRWL